MLLDCSSPTHLFQIFLKLRFFSPYSSSNLSLFLLISFFFNYLSFLLNFFLFLLQTFLLFFFKFHKRFFLSVSILYFFPSKRFLIFISSFFVSFFSSFLLLCLFQPFQKQLRVLFRISKDGSRKHGWIFIRRNAMDFVIGANAPISTWMPLS